MPTFAYQEILETGHHDSTPWQRISSDHVEEFEA